MEGKLLERLAQLDPEGLGDDEAHAILIFFIFWARKERDYAPGADAPAPEETASHSTNAPNGFDGTPHPSIGAQRDGTFIVGRLR